MQDDNLGPHWRRGSAPFHYGRWAFDPDYGWIHVMDRAEVRVYRPSLAPAPGARPPAARAPARPATPDAERQRLEREVRRVDSHHQQEKSRMESRQRAEARQSPPGDAEQVRRRHEAEQKALDGQKARERKVREQRIEKQIQKPAPAKPPEQRRPAAREKRQARPGPAQARPPVARRSSQQREASHPVAARGGRGGPRAALRGARRARRLS